MPPKSTKSTKTKKTVGGDGKTRIIFEADYASAQQKRLQELRSHATLQFNYREIAHPLTDDSNEERIWCHPSETLDKGRVLIADMDFKPGDIIYREKPLLSASWNNFQCHECAEPHKYTTCRTFQGIYGKDSKLAKNMTKIEDLLMDYNIIGDFDRARLFIKAVWLLKLAPDAQCWEEIARLTTAGTQQDEYVQCIESFRKKLLVKESELIDDSLPTAQLVQLLAILNNNSHEIEGFGSGIWLYSSLLEHSCSANCNFVTSQDELLLVALKHIPSGSSLSIDYNIATYKPNAQRQEQYRSHYGFTCTCEMCTIGYDRPRAFYCPQSIRHYANYVHELQQPDRTFIKGQFGPEQTNSLIFPGMVDTKALTLGNSNLYNDIAQYINILQANQPINQSTRNELLGPNGAHQSSFHKVIAGLYTFNGVQFDLKKNTYPSQRNPDWIPSDISQQKCIDGTVYPIGDGSSIWKCSGCGYILSPAEIAICRMHENEITPPPSVSQSDTFEDVEELFHLHNYTLPTLQQINSWVSHGVVHISHSSIYWTLYVLALKWTQKATDACYTLESTATRQSQQSSKNLKGVKKRAANSQPVKTTFQEDQTDENTMDAVDYQNCKRLQFFSTTYTPSAHTVEALHKQHNESTRQQANSMDEMSGSLDAQEKAKQHINADIIPNHIELPLLCEHLWSIIAESASKNLDPLHPELLIIYDYLAQVQILKKRSKKAKAIWYYCFELSKLINSPISKETYRIKRLVTHTPRTIAQLQHHYQTIDELYQQMAFHNEDTSTLNILKQFTLTAIDSDSDDEQTKPQGENSTHENHDNVMESQLVNDSDDDDDDDQDADDLFLNSALGQSIVQKSLQHQQVKKQQETSNSQQMSMGMSSTTSLSTQQQSNAAPQAQFTNSFGFSSTQLFGSNTTTSTPSGFVGGGFATFGNSSTPSKSTQSQLSTDKPFASISTFGSPSTTTPTPTTVTPTTTFQPFSSNFTPSFGGFSPGKPAQPTNSSLPSDPFAGLNFGPK